jgi:hypothetical protein
MDSHIGRENLPYFETVTLGMRWSSLAKTAGAHSNVHVAVGRTLNDRQQSAHFAAGGFAVAAHQVAAMRKDAIVARNEHDSVTVETDLRRDTAVGACDEPLAYSEYRNA